MAAESILRRYQGSPSPLRISGSFRGGYFKRILHLTQLLGHYVFMLTLQKKQNSYMQVSEELGVSCLGSAHIER
jgi:hypothetical protein